MHAVLVPTYTASYLKKAMFKIYQLPSPKIRKFEKLATVTIAKVGRTLVPF